MTTLDTTQWYSHPYEHDLRPLVSDPDPDGNIPVVTRTGFYMTVTADRLGVTIPERHTVEWRKRKKGERFIKGPGTVSTAGEGNPDERWVIVE